MNGDIGRAIVPYLVGTMFFAIGISWHWIKPTLGPKLVASVTRGASDFRWWMGVLALLFLYLGSPRVIEAFKGSAGRVDQATNIITHNVPPPKAAQSSQGAIAEPTSPLPLRPYYSPREKAELADGIKILKGYVQNDVEKVKKKIVAVDESVRTKTPGMRGPTYQIKMDQQSIEAAMGSVSALRMNIVEFREARMTGSPLLDDQAYMRETEFIINITEYKTALNNILQHIDPLLNSLTKGLDASRHTVDPYLMGMAMERVAPELQSLFAATAALDEWNKEVNRRADAIRNSIPP